MAEARELVEELLASGKKAVFAESCTAGLAADLVASVPGASEVFWGSFVTYSPEAKIRLLGVPEDIIKTRGAVSRETACAMAEGALEKSGCDFAVSVTGLAGPGGDGTSTPVGTVWIATARRGEKALASLCRFEGSRNEVRRLAADKAVSELLKCIRLAAKNPVSL